MYYEDQALCGCTEDEKADGCGAVCKRTIAQKADVSIPIDINPTAVVGRIQSECLGEPKITRDKCKDTCMITVTQTISVKIPIQYKVSTNVGESEVVCHNI
jgi:hypothetical protein